MRSDRHRCGGRADDDDDDDTCAPAQSSELRLADCAAASRIASRWRWRTAEAGGEVIAQQVHRVEIYLLDVTELLSFGARLRFAKRASDLRAVCERCKREQNKQTKQTTESERTGERRSRR